MRPLATLSAAALAALPAQAAAAMSLIQLSDAIQRTVYKPLVGVIIGVALVLFVWGVFRYISQSGDEAKAAEGVKMMSYGIVVLFVMFSVWAIVRMFLAFFGIGTATASPGSTSVFGIEARDYDPGLNYAPVDRDDDELEVNRRGYQP
jgi:hypothetical protein